MSDPLSQVFAALADPTRRDMVARLTDGDATVGQLAAPYRVSVQAISKHLKVLDQAGRLQRKHQPKQEQKEGTGSCLKSNIIKHQPNQPGHCGASRGSSCSP